MSHSRVFPFRRVSVDHMVRGSTRVWWQLEPTFNQPGPYIFQLQLGKTGLRDAADWRNIGSPVTNGYLAYDPAWHESGYELLSHYRVTLTTPTDVYVSQAANCYGELHERDWVLSREIIRKERVRHKYVSVPGYLVKPMRFGTPCTRCRDQLTQELLDADCPICSGTGFEIGYHPALPMQCWDLSTQTIQEDIDNEVKGTTRVEPYVTARVIGFPALNKDDIWVNSASDERWLIDSIQIAAAIRNVPIIYQVKLGLLPFNSAAYALEVGGEPAARPGPVLPIAGCGNIVVDHDYGGPDDLIYADATGRAISGAKIHVFTEAVYDAAYPALPNPMLAIGGSTTTTNGRWTTAVKLNAGNYVITFDKPGEYGPDIRLITASLAGGGMSYTQAPEPVSAPEDIIVKKPKQSRKPEKAPDDFWEI